MNVNDPQILYMILVIPCFFGLTLVGEGINNLVHEEKGGVVFIIFGFLFIGLIIFAYIFFSSYLVTSMEV
jgi:hypothetical protein